MVVEVGMLLAALGFGAFAFIRWRRNGIRILDGLGLRGGRAALADFLAGLLIAGVAMVGIFLIESGLSGIRASHDHAVSSAFLLFRQASGMLLTALKEELLMRGLLLSGLVLALRGRLAWAVALSAASFGLIHLCNPGASAMSVFGNALGGLIYGMAFVSSRQLWLSFGLHFGWNFAQGPLIGFPVSGLPAGGLQRLADLGPAWLTGGAYGPEAGLIGICFRFVIIALVVLYLRSRPPWMGRMTGMAGPP
ncbi:CPBP family intramembrane glutamic endopeptidase [Geothrix sp. 21YS21S-2]|uniref:CPBP family intramembrane glutamic endopeptidase n=1 Tax=Geothrix sp. 21YS21S-2 TaxID=3068893 RepID=UPI0027B9743A|nr:CPBP family intramembrane glutamic endopeptidase [Geothrix sp. 21YS21S-2]